MSARSAFAVAAVLTVATIALAAFLLRVRSAYDDYQNTPACYGPVVSATCRGRIPATVVQVIITDAAKYRKAEYALRLDGTPPAYGLVHFTRENDVLDTASPGDIVQTEIWRGRVTKVDLDGTVAGTTVLPSSVESVALACTLGAGGLALVFLVYGIGKRRHGRSPGVARQGHPSHHRLRYGRHPGQPGRPGRRPLVPDSAGGTPGLRTPSLVGPHEKPRR